MVLIGHDFSNGEYYKHVQKLNLSEKIFFLPAISPKEIGNYLNLCDVFILPTRYDGWGIVLNEAASIGKPLISTSRAGGAWHLIKEGQNGYMVSPDVEGLSMAMQKYVDSPNLIKLHGKISEQIFDAEFSASRNADRFISYLQEFEK